MARENFYKTIIAILSGACILLVVMLAVQRAGVRAPLGERTRRPAKAAVKTQGRIAIVIDDVGYSLSNLATIDAIAYPLTFSVLPGTAHAPEAAQRLRKMGFQIILHLPMEPHETMGLEPDTITTDMDEARIRAIISADIQALPRLKGVSNHMGSKATVDPRVVEIVLDEVRKRRMFFLDSFVTPRSVCAEAARKKRVRFAKRDVFLDNDSDPEYIRRQLDVLKEKARANGSAIGIGHDRKNTLEVLRGAIPELSKEGFRFVFVSELAR